MKILISVFLFSLSLSSNLYSECSAVNNSPTNGEIIHTITPTLQWSITFNPGCPMGCNPTGPYLSYLRIATDSAMNNNIYTASSTGTSLTIPNGVLQNNNRYWWNVQFYASCYGFMCGLQSCGALSIPFCFTPITIGIGTISGEIPTDYKLEQNYPNPFNPKTIIRYQIPSDVKRETSDVKLVIYNVLGKEIVTLVNEKQVAGKYFVEWDASNYPSGVYFYHIVIHSDKLQAGEFTETKKMLLVK